MRKMPVYRRKTAALERRVTDLLQRLTVEEKIAQLQAGVAAPLLNLAGDNPPVFSGEKAAALYPHGLGRLSAMSHAYPMEVYIALYNALQRHFIENTRLGIPVLADCEGLHGCMAPGSTSFPQAIGLAATWSPGLLEAFGRAVGREAYARGNQQALSPVLDIARDVRAGRTEETYGEDPYLVTRLGVAYIRGLQSQRVAATPKHFAANFVGDGGRDSFPIHFSERHLREVYLPPYAAAVKEAGAMGIMSAYHALDGRPCSANKWLLTDLLKKEWGFKGAVVSDWDAVHQIVDYHAVARDYADCARQALLAGLDIELPTSLCFKHLPELVRQGKVPLAVINEAVRRVLRIKFWSGLFDHPYASLAGARAVTNCREHQALALKAARASIVLLKNDGRLPFRRDLKSVAVIGPHAAVGRLGGYSAKNVAAISPLAGLQSILTGRTKVLHAAGCGLTTTDRRLLREALQKARQAEAVILCVGNSSPETEGEGQDRCNLDLPAAQVELIRAIVRVNPRTVVVLFGGSAITLRAWSEKVGAIVEAWYPGQAGGRALAEVLFGLVNPSGKLPITFPKTTGQCPLYYNTKPSGRLYDYNDLRKTQAQFPFGHGLSYTRFEYSRLRVAQTGRGAGQKLTISARIKNIGPVAGEEIVQLYLRDEHSRFSRPLKELKGFQRLALRPGEARPVRFVLAWQDLAYLGEQLKPVLEPGNLVVMLGASAEDIRLRSGAGLYFKSMATAYAVSALLAPVSDIRAVAFPPRGLNFTALPVYGIYTNLTEKYGEQHGLTYLRTSIDMPRPGRGTLLFGADSPVKVWLRGQAVACELNATNPIQLIYRAPVHWQAGANEIVFAISTNHGQAWGVCAAGAYRWPKWDAK